MGDKRFRSILDEISNTPVANKELFIEGQAAQVIASVANLIKLINESYDEETSSDLQKRLILAIKNQDEDRFNRKIRGLRGNKNEI